ncbi:hypothetical protein DRO97_04985 [Archaeoglobales archaeon]|nr:MAG: hypothetical protein DRO97_04985 [Archaeoglobales archaeon]
MKEVEVKIKIPTPNDFLCGEFGKHMLKAYKEFLLAVASIPHRHVKRIEELEKRIEERKKEGS